MKKTMLMAMAILFAATTAFAVKPNNSGSDTTKAKKSTITKVIYTCSMHTDVASLKPGKCPKPGCGMALVKKTDLKKKSAEKMKM